MLTLAIDTSTNILSIALVRDDEILAHFDEPTKNNQSEILMTRIETLMKHCELKPSDLEKIAVAIGPGSYTGVRVGVTVAKTLAFALAIPIVGISSLQVMMHLFLNESGTTNATAQKDENDLIVAMIDARRGAVFSATYASNGELMIPEGHHDMKAYLEKLPSEKSFAVIGDETLASKEPWVIKESSLKGSKAVSLALMAQALPPQENVHQLLPNYLRKTEAEMNVER